MIALLAAIAIMATGAAAARAIACSDREARLRRAGAASPKSREARGRLPWGAAAMAGGVAGGSFLGFALAGPVGAAAGGAGGGFMVHGLARRRAAREALADEDAFANVVDAVAAATRAGLSLRQAFAESATEATPSLRRRIDGTLARIEVGEPLGRALAPLATGSRDGYLFAGVIDMNARVGGELPKLLDRVAHVISERTRARRRVSALTAQGRASGAVLAVLPVAFVGLLSGTGGSGLGAFYRTTLGAGLLAAGLALEGLGFVWIRWILRRAA